MSYRAVCPQCGIEWIEPEEIDSVISQIERMNTQRAAPQYCSLECWIADPEGKGVEWTTNSPPSNP